jgi:hypothetical protein
MSWKVCVIQFARIMQIMYMAGMPFSMSKGEIVTSKRAKLLLCNPGISPDITPMRQPASMESKKKIKDRSSVIIGISSFTCFYICKIIVIQGFAYL